MAMDAERRESLARFLGRFGISPDSKTIELVEEAFTHSSYAYENQLAYDNERLEFLGDAVIGLLAAEYVYHRFPDAPEGELSKRKGRLVSRTILGRRARDLGLADYLLLGRGEEQSGGRRRPVLLGSALESFVGALYLSLGWEKTADFVKRHIITPVEGVALAAEDYKSQLQEIVQKRHRIVPEYRLVREVGPDHDKKFFVEVYVKGEKLGEGWGKRKKSAENEAARSALEKLGVFRRRNLAGSTGKTSAA